MTDSTQTIGLADKDAAEELFRRGGEIEQLKLELARVRSSYHHALWAITYVSATVITALILDNTFSWQLALVSLGLPYPLFVLTRRIVEDE